jgi:hypothetical protein
MQLYRYFVSQSSEFCRHNPLRCFSTSVYFCKRIFRYRRSPETFRYTLVAHLENCLKQPQPSNAFLLIKYDMNLMYSRGYTTDKYQNEIPLVPYIVHSRS